MPRYKINYSKSIIYKIHCIDPEVTDCYIGSTTNFSQKKYFHKHCYYNESSPYFHCELYKKIRETNGWDNWQMTMVAIVNCANHNELMIEEQNFSLLCNATLSVLHKDNTSSVQSLNKSSKVYTKSSKNYTKSSNIEENVFSCQVCQYTTCRKSNLNKHLATNKHHIKIKSFKDFTNEPFIEINEPDETNSDDNDSIHEITNNIVTDIYTEINVNLCADIQKENREEPFVEMYDTTPLHHAYHMAEPAHKYNSDGALSNEDWVTSARIEEIEEQTYIPKCKPEQYEVNITGLDNMQTQEVRMMQSYHTTYNNDMDKNSEYNDSKYCKRCKKVYKSRNGLWKHKKVCDSLPLEIVEGTELNYVKPINELLAASNQVLNANETLTHTVMDLIKQNQDLQKQLIELAKEGRNTIINNTTNNSFNLRVYLNETCKDAVNMMDFVNSLHLQLTDLEETGRLGYSNGMSRIFINGLKEMDACKRPIHCSDLKREILYIKEDNVWEKDTDTREKIKKAIRKIEQKNIQQIPLWIKAHPNCVVGSNRENIPYLKMVMHSTGGLNPDEESNMNKIISNIAKEVCINKECNM